MKHLLELRDKTAATLHDLISSMQSALDDLEEEQSASEQEVEDHDPESDEPEPELIDNSDDIDRLEVAIAEAEGALETLQGLVIMKGRAI